MESSEVRPVNLGNLQRHTMGDIIGIVIGLLISRINFESLPQDDPKRRCLETLGGPGEPGAKNRAWRDARGSRDPLAVSPSVKTCRS
jgi:hypothetical protein